MFSYSKCIEVDCLPILLFFPFPSNNNLNGNTVFKFFYFMFFSHQFSLLFLHSSFPLPVEILNLISAVGGQEACGARLATPPT